MALKIHLGIMKHHLIWMSPYRRELRGEGNWLSLEAWTQRRHEPWGVLGSVMLIYTVIVYSGLKVQLALEWNEIMLGVLSIWFQVLDLLSDEAIFGVASVGRNVLAERIESSVKANVSSLINAVEHLVDFPFEVEAILCLRERVSQISELLLQPLYLHLYWQVKIKTALWRLATELRDIVLHHRVLSVVHRNMVSVLHALFHLFTIAIDRCLSASSGEAIKLWVSFSGEKWDNSGVVIACPTTIAKSFVDSLLFLRNCLGSWNCLNFLKLLKLLRLQ